jgi:hypothetical protein
MLARANYVNRFTSGKKNRDAATPPSNLTFEGRVLTKQMIHQSSIMGLQQKRNKNDYRREPDLLIPMTTPAQVLSEPHQRSRADPPDFGRPAVPPDY